MPLTLQSELTTIRTQLELDGILVILRATLSPSTEMPDDGNHIIVDLIPTAPDTDFGGSVYEDLSVQLQVWSDTSLVSALASAEAARGRMEALNYYRSAGTQVQRDETYVGVIMTFTHDAMFDSLA